MLDFTNLPTSNKLYPGGSGAKRAVIYQGEQYLLKFPATSSKNKKSGHSTSYAAEYIGCHIFNSVGIRAQDTILGIYRKNGEEKAVVACKDFTSPGVVLQDFASLQNSVIDYGHSCYSMRVWYSRSRRNPRNGKTSLQRKRKRRSIRYPNCMTLPAVLPS